MKSFSGVMAVRTKVKKKLMKRNCLSLLTLVSTGLNASCEIHHVRISNYVFLIASDTISLLMRQNRYACNGTWHFGLVLRAATPAQNKNDALL